MAVARDMTGSGLHTSKYSRPHYPIERIGSNLFDAW